MANANLTKAKAAKNDEFYTVIADIACEMNAYYDYNPDVFRGKTILCPCDDPNWSNFTKHFTQNFVRYGLKKLICTGYNKGGHGMKYVLEGDTNGNGKVEETDIVATEMEGDGDFRSEEVKALLPEVDFIITNPPFSLFREFIAWIMENNKKFSIIGNMNAITYKEVFPLIRNNDIWLGASKFNGGWYFRVPADFVYAPTYKGVRVQNGVNVCQVPSCCWFTNIDYSRRHEPLDLCTMAQLKKRGVEFPKYDNYDAIEVSKVDYIPKDYDGVMGVPITFLAKHCPEQFEIVAFRKGEDGKDLVFTREREREFNRTFGSLSRDDRWEEVLRKWQTDVRTNSDTEQKKSSSILSDPYSGMVGWKPATVNGKRMYARIPIRRIANR